MKKFLVLGFIFFLNSFLQADVAHGVLEKYKNKVFVNTGIYSCINIARALNANFSEIYGMEEDKVLVDHSQIVIPIFIKDSKPKNLKNYCIYNGDSRTELTNIIDNIKYPITFLLSSHLPALDQPEKVNGVLFELEQIKKHPIKTHTILIEYIQYAGTPYFGNITLDAIKNKLLEINPNYKFKFEKGGHLEKEENAILAAYL